MRKKIAVLWGVALTLFIPPLNGQILSIARSHPADEQYTQQQNELEDWYQALRNGQRLQEPTLYRYRLSAPESVITLAAKFSLPYESITTINRIANNETLPAESDLLIPSAPGLYVTLNPINDLEHILYAQYVTITPEQRGIVINIDRDGTEEQFIFFPGVGFSKVERLAFFKRLFQIPVRSGYISSEFGPRNDPISNIQSFHGGIDIASQYGARIYAAQQGVVRTVVEDNPLFGNYVIVEHIGGFITLYAHLQTALVAIDDRVTVASTIGLVGNSGHSTGAHLHFEIRLNNRRLDPKTYMHIPAYLKKLQSMDALIGDSLVLVRQLRHAIGNGE